MIEIFDCILSFFTELFFNPQKRVFIGYLFSAMLIGITWSVFIKKTSITKALSLTFSRKVWLSYSAKSDYILLVLNKFIMAFISPLLVSQIVIATFWFESLHKWFIPEASDDWPKWLIMTLFTATLFLLDDASKYLVHRWLHKSKMLWRFHRVHHSATSLTPLTIFRTHPVEGILFGLRSAGVQGVAIGIFVFNFGSQVDLISVLGINVMLFVFNLLGSNLRHSHIAIHYPKAIERWFMSPAQHQIHHSTSPKHFDQNFGVVLTIWDRMGNSFHFSEVNEPLDFGVLEKGEIVKLSVIELYLMPFVEIYTIIHLQIKSIFDRYSKYLDSFNHLFQRKESKSDQPTCNRVL